VHHYTTLSLRIRFSNANLTSALTNGWRGGVSELAVVAKLEECMEEDMELDTRELDVDVNSVGVRDVESESESSKVEGE
jgi:hypothetical protein